MRGVTTGYPIPACLIVLTGSFLLLSGCGGGSGGSSPNGFGMAASSQTRNPTGTGDPIISSVALNADSVTGGGPVSVRVTLAEPAPAAGLAVQLATSDTAAVKMPPTLQIAAGQNSATLEVPTALTSVSALVTITASYANSKAGASLNVVPAAVPFTVTVQPATLTVQQGKSGTAKVSTKVSSGYNHSLQLKFSGDPVGVSTSAKPAVIPAPGSGTSQVTVGVQTVTAAGKYPIGVTATDGKNSAAAKLTLSVTSGTGNPNATFKGCWYTSSGHRYQAVDISVGNPGTYPFNAVLYSGTTCNASSYADQFGFGNPITLGGFGYTFWFTDFKDQTNMSAIWYLGDENSKCVNYSTAPAC